MRATPARRETKGRQCTPEARIKSTCRTPRQYNPAIMTAHFGVKCKTVDPLGGKDCKTVFEFASVEHAGITNLLEIPVPPLGGLVCPVCKKLHHYVSDEVVHIGLLHLSEKPPEGRRLDTIQ
jgi:hypothetical protein